MTEQDSETELHAQLAQWGAELGEALELGVIPFDIDAVLALAGDAARAVVRPAAPVTTFIVGIAVGRAVESGRLSLDQALAAAAGVASKLALSRGSHDGGAVNP
jgi:hypothetical protein